MNDQTLKPSPATPPEGAELQTISSIEPGAEGVFIAMYNKALRELAGARAEGDQLRADVQVLNRQMQDRQAAHEETVHELTMQRDRLQGRLDQLRTFSGGLIGGFAAVKAAIVDLETRAMAEGIKAAPGAEPPAETAKPAAA